MMHPIVLNAMAQAGAHMASVIRTMFDGVAFRRDGQTYDVYSHEGDELGTLSTADVNFAIHLMKRMGRPVGKLKHNQYDRATQKFSLEYEPAFTFAWSDWLLDKTGNRF
jgi:hypothetical protein